MIPAELQRLILMVALAATGYLLILAWNDDYGDASSRVAVTSTPDAEAGPGAAPDLVAPSLPNNAVGVQDSDVPGNDFVPGRGISEPSSAAALPTPEVAAATNRLVKVFTDTLELWIDLKGGDIVRARLPQYPVTLDEGAESFVVLDRSGGRTYVAQSGLIGPNGSDAGGERPLFKTASTDFDFRGQSQAGVVTLETTHNGVGLKKTFRFAPDAYSVEVGYQVSNTSSQPFAASLFGQIKRDSKPAVGASSGSALGPRPYLGFAITTAESRYEKIEFDDLDESELREEVEGGWVSLLQHYFLSAWIPNAEENNLIWGRARSDGTYTVGFTGPTKTIASGATGEWQAEFYVGPKDQDRLAELAENLNLTVDYGFLWWMAVPLFKLLQFLQGFVGNWGVAIILMTFVVKLILYPLSAASFRSMANMRRVAPKMKRLQERYADDRQKLSQEMMALYKKEKVNPLGGCFPMLLQMPVFLALYWVLFESVELRQAPFFAWITDLAAMDDFFVLPILMGASMYFMQTLNPAPIDPMQAKVMKFMPIMFTALFLFFPAGLVLYWLTNNVLSMAQQWTINRQIENAAKASG